MHYLDRTKQASRPEVGGHVLILKSKSSPNPATVLVIFKKFQKIVFLAQQIDFILLVRSDGWINQFRDCYDARGPYLKLPHLASNYQMQTQMQKYSLKLSKRE